MCVHYRRLKKDRPVPPSAAPVTKDEDEKESDPATQKVQHNDFVVGAAKQGEKKEADPAMQKLQDNDFVVGADPGNTSIIAIAVPKRAEDGIDGNLCQKDMRLLRFSIARYDRESGIMNARKKTETWNAGMKDHLEAMSEMTSRGADFQAFREFMGGPRCSLVCAVKRVDQAPVGSSVYESILWEAACIRELFQ